MQSTQKIILDLKAAASASSLKMAHNCLGRMQDPQVTTAQQWKGLSEKGLGVKVLKIKYQTGLDRFII